MLTGRFHALLSFVEHRAVEIRLRHPSIIRYWRTSYYVGANDPTQSFVVKSRICRIQHKLPPILDFMVDLLITSTIYTTSKITGLILY